MITVRGHGRSLKRTVLYRLFAKPTSRYFYHLPWKSVASSGINGCESEGVFPWVNPCSVIAGVLECNKLNNMKDINFITLQFIASFQM